MTINIYLLVSIDVCAKGYECKRSESETLLSKWDAHKCEAKKNTNDHVYDRELKTTENSPDKIQHRVTVKVGVHKLSKGPNSITSYFNVLDAKRDTDDGYAQSYTQNKMKYGMPKSVKNKPDKITYNFHYAPPKKYFTFKLYHKCHTLSI